MLRRLRELLTPSGVLLVGVVVPWRPAVLRRAGRSAAPSEALPAAVREAASFEQSAAALATAVLELTLTRTRTLTLTLTLPRASACPPSPSYLASISPREMRSSSSLPMGYGTW